ncbi:hypothetical protein [Mycetocola miduiensis]|uniref:Prepilin-type N-terminal cleavage/methylation domain-containing protein n=1 Tax=Mycetocola miduiensis TaxID=995034 RepID=A0A1I5D1M3_9MICO|nr:hypothetical protein [Mycetocola miduiensis]SFN93026.1 hypothetical protein SAMN05216219_2651 [Mycetocola miduiensis]
MKNTTQGAAADDSGLGIVEIVVSMFLLALLAMAFLPLLIQGMTASVKSATVATASQLLNQQLDLVRAVPPNCAAVQAFDDAVVPSTTDARGTAFQPVREVLACPASYPGVVNVKVMVKEGADVLAEAVTLVYVESATAPAPTPVPAP